MSGSVSETARPAHRAMSDGRVRFAAMVDQEQRHAIRGADLALWQSGSGDRDLVFVHGFPNDHTAWRPLVERLDADRYRFTSFDLLGCGASGAADTWERCTIDEYGADLTAVCDLLDIDRPIVLGHSVGAATILSAALATPRRFAGLVLIAPASTTGLGFLRRVKFRRPGSSDT